MHFKILRPGYALLLTALALSGISCEKKYIDIVPVAELERDISIPNAGDIRFLDFQTELAGYSADSVNIYQTTNGGANWQPVQTPPGAGNISNLVFFNQTHALCLRNGKVYATANSGQTWTYKADAVFAGISADGKGVYGYPESVMIFQNGTYIYERVCRVYVSANQGSTFQHFKDVPTAGYFAQSGYVTGSKVYIATENTGFSRYLHGLDLETGATGQAENLSLSMGIPKQLTEYGNTRLQVNFGLMVESTDSYFRATHYHVGGYSSGSVYNNLVVGAGHHSIIANLDIGTGDYFTELLDVNGQPFNKEFYKVQAVGPRNFYVAGENGLIWKMKI